MMIEIDASIGEGGGQIVRTSLALALCTAVGVSLHEIRAHRRNPGLRAQHLAAVRAAAAICGAQVAGATTGSRALSFQPGPVQPGRYEIDVGTAGSTMLVLQTILLPLSLCGAPSSIVLRGGTHNPRAPTFEFIRDSYLPILKRLGFTAHLDLERHGFFPRGGGIVHVHIEPRTPAAALELLDRGPVRAKSARVLLAALPTHIAEREIAVVRERLALPAGACAAQTVAAIGPGNVLQVQIDCAEVTSVFAGFGLRGVPAEEVAGGVVEEVERYLEANVAIDLHLADQLLLPLALASGGVFTTLPPSAHAETNAAVIARFLPLEYTASELPGGRWRLAIRAARSGAIEGSGAQRRDSGAMVG